MHPLTLHRFFLRFALAGANVFAWVFLFHLYYLREQNLDFALAQTALLYALSSVITCLVTPLTARLVRNGIRRALVYALLCIAGAFVLLGAAFEGFWSAEHTMSAIVAFAVLLGIYRALYWVPYEVASAVEGKWRDMLGELSIATAPALAGIGIAFSPLAAIWIFYIAAGLVVLSALPLFAVADVYEGFSWSYRRTFHELLSPANRPYVTHALLEGMGGAALLLFWPLAVFLLLGWSYGMLGVVLSIAFFVAILLRAPIRTLMRSAGFNKSRLLTTVFATTPWLFRLTVLSPLSIVAVDSYFYTTTPKRLGVDPFAFEQNADGGSLIDEFTALKEMALHLGRVAACVLAALTAYAISTPAAFAAVFILAALCSASLALSGR